MTDECTIESSFDQWQLLTRACLYCSMVQELQLMKAELTMNSSSAAIVVFVCAPE